MKANAESTTQGQGGAENRAPECTGQPHGQGQPDFSRRGNGDFAGGITGATRSGGIAGDPVTGGIIAQLIAQVEDQLGEAVECVQWYERSVEKYQRQLENLKQLQQLAEQEAND